MSKSIGEALAAVMEEVSAIGKNRRNTQQSYSFRGIDDFANMLHPVLAKHGVVLRPRVHSSTYLDSYSTKNGANMFRVTVTLDVGFVAPDGSEHVVRTVGEGADTGDKATNKAMSAALKYALLMTFLVPTEERELRDSEEDSHEAMPMAARGTPAETGMAVLAGGRQGAQRSAREALAARVRKLPGSPSRAAALRDLAGDMSPEQFADCAEWVVCAEAEVESLRRQGDALQSRQPAHELDLDEAGFDEAVRDMPNARAATIEATEASMRAQLEAAQKAQGCGPVRETEQTVPPDPGKPPTARKGRKPGKAVTPAAVAEALTVPPVGPTERMRAVTGEGEGWDL